MHQPIDPACLDYAISDDTMDADEMRLHVLWVDGDCSFTLNLQNLL